MVPGPNTYDRFVTLVQKFLRDKGATSPDTGRAGKDIVAAIKKQKSINLAQASLWNYLNHAANHDNKSGIVSEGRYKGYWFKETAAASIAKLEKEAKIEVSEVIKKEKVYRERALYDIVRQWLKDKEYQAELIDAIKAGGKWGNPDVAGLKVAQELGLIDVEIVTIEVKSNVTSWRTDIFEAISHKRFANRVYFCFPVTEGTDKLDEDMIRYCEIYKIGIIHIYLSDDIFKQLLEAAGSASLPKLEADTALVSEKIPAPYDFVPPRFQLEFLKRIGVNSQQRLHNFGSR